MKVGSESDDALVHLLADQARTIAAAEAAQLILVAELHRRAPGWMRQLRDSSGAVPLQELREVTAAEVGSALAITRNAALAMVDLASAAETRLRPGLEALAEGKLSLRKFMMLDEHTMVMTDDGCAEVQARVLPVAAQQSPPTFRARLARAVIAVEPAAAKERRVRAHEDRRVRIYPGYDDMSTVSAVLPAVQARRWFDALTATAEAALTDGDDRGLDQARADTLLDLLLQPPVDPPPGRDGHSRPVTVHVTVSAATLAGLDDEPGDLAGHGPITADTARELAADGTWRRILTDPETGTVRDVGRTTYAPPAAMADRVRARDHTCRFPGCRQPAARCDLDHTVPYPDGPTADDNLSALCRSHHRTKTFTRWRMEHLPGAIIQWTSPTGRRYVTHPWPPDPDPPPF